VAGALGVPVALLAAVELKQEHAQTLLLHVEGQHVPVALPKVAILNRVHQQ